VKLLSNGPPQGSPKIPEPLAGLLVGHDYSQPFHEAIQNIKVVTDDTMSQIRLLLTLDQPVAPLPST
jgi:hypothetical protein